MKKKKLSLSIATLDDDNKANDDLKDEIRDMLIHDIKVQYFEKNENINYSNDKSVMNIKEYFEGRSYKSDISYEWYNYYKVEF